MKVSHLGRAIGSGLFASALLTTAALAHHGWTWTSTDPFTLEGVILEIYIGNPHVTLEVMTPEGQWHVDLAPLAPTMQAGFDQNAASIGDPVMLFGHRSLDPNQRSMKAVRVVVNGRTYDVYPDRVGPFAAAAN